MLRSGLAFILPSVSKLFNIILNSQTFSDLWNIAYQVPLFKGGDVYNTNDYRGISVTSCLGKIFNKTLNTRLQTKLKLTGNYWIIRKHIDQIIIQLTRFLFLKTY